MKIGFVGLGKMGSRMVEKIVRDGHEVVAWNRSPEPAAELQATLSSSTNLTIAASIPELVANLETPRVVMMMLPAGDATDSRLDEVKSAVEANDIVIDGSNSFYEDTERHFKECSELGLRFLGIGVSGGIIALTDGYPMMVGGDRDAYDHVMPILNSLATPHGGHEYFGSGGAGHFVKMVHNGIEYPIMQALSEGFGVMANSSYNFDLVKVAKLYQKGTLVSGFMLDRTVEVLEDDPKLKEIAGVIGSASGEAVWTVNEAKAHNLPAESIEHAIAFRRRSETDPYVQNSFAAKMVGALRIKFGGHPVKKKDAQ